MDINAIRLNLGNKLDAIQKGESEAENILIMVTSLLEELKNSPESFKKADEKELRKFMKYCSKITRYTKEFADDYGSDIASAAKLSISAVNENADKLSALENDCNDIEKTENTIARQIDEINEKNSELLAKKDSLKKRKDEYDSLSKKVTECRDIIENITDDKIDGLKKEISAIEKDAESRKTENDELMKKVEEAKKAIEILEKDNNRITSEIKSTNEKIKAYKAEIEKLTSQYSADTGEAKRLAKTLKEAKDHLDEISAVLEQNNKISEQLRKNGFVLDDSSVENNFYNYVKEMQKKSEAVIDDYNKLLANVIEASTKLYKDIIERQEPSYK